MQAAQSALVILGSAAPALSGRRMIDHTRTPRTLLMKKTHEESFLAAFDEHADALFRHAAFRLSDREKAKDLTQDTFIKAWEYLREGGEVREWKSFLYRILHNAIIDEYRRKKSRSLDALVEEHSPTVIAGLSFDGHHEIETAVDESILIERVRELIPTLGEAEQTALTLRYIDGLSPRDIAQILGVSENVASVRIHRAVEHLKKTVKERYKNI
jgi:RNA polymerase sigma-70 factor, ECF subfamily